jgi:hypothetical protein
MLRRTPAFPSRPCREAARRTGSPRDHAEHLLDKLEYRYPSGEWALLHEVKSSNIAAAAAHDVLRRAEALAVKLSGHWWQIEGFQLKVSRADWLRELRDPTKCGPLQAFCSAFWVVVPAPRKAVIHSLDELPNRWGLMEAGTGEPVVIVEAALRQAEEPTAGFGMELVRRALARGQRGDGRQIAGVPLRTISRILDREHVGLVCGHVAPRPLAKREPGLVPCGSCAMGLPGDEEIVTAAIQSATPEEKARYRALLGELERDGSPRCTCEEPGADALLCARVHLRGRGVPQEVAWEAATLEPCPCACHPREEGAS